uniref:Synaptonemal complex protein 3 n=1 Tax=Oryzias latipes TaxID=8090 RepID=H2LNU9_ORYLA
MESVRKVEKVAKKRSAAVFEEGADECAAGNEVQSMLEKFGADINKAMQVKQKHLECLTKNHMTGSQHKLEFPSSVTFWKTYKSYKKNNKTTQQFSQRVSTAFQQWEAEAHRTEEQEEKLSNLFRQQQKVLQQARVAQNQKLKVVRELYDQFVKNMEEMEKSQNEFLQAAQEELKREMATLQKKLLMEAQQQEMATVRKSLQTMFF